MTVHGAKGLEAPIVILPDTCAAQKADEGLFISESGAPIWVGAEANDIAYSAALRLDAKARALREHRRLLYVALTRAQDRLVVAGAASGKHAAGHPDTAWYAVCEQAMTRLENAGAAQRVDVDGREIRRFGDAPELLLPAVLGDKDEAKLPQMAAQGGAASSRRRSACSRRRAFRPRPNHLCSRPSARGARTRLRRGTLIHLLFEALPDIPKKDRRKAAAGYLKRQLDLSLPGRRR